MNTGADVPHLHGSRILVRPLSPADITDDYVSGLRDTDVTRFLVEVKRRHQTSATVTEFVRANADAPDAVLLGIFLKPPAETLIGTVRIYDISRFHWCASIGICIFRKDLWGSGVGTEALLLAKRYAFDHLELHYLEAGIYTLNQGSLKAFINSGFFESYRISEKYCFENRFEEVVFVAAVNPEFDNQKLVSDRGGSS